MRALTLIKQAEQDSSNSGFNPAYGLYGAGAAAGIGAGVMYHNSAKEHKESQQKEIDMQQKKITGYKQELQKAQNELDESLKKYNTPLGDIPTKIHQVQRDRDAVYDQINKAKEKVENGGDRKELDELINKEKEMTKQVAHLQDGEFFHQVSKPLEEDIIKGKEGSINIANNIINKSKNSKPYIKLHTKLLGAGAVGLIGAGAYLQHRQNQNKG